MEAPSSNFNVCEEVYSDLLESKKLEVYRKFQGFLPSGFDELSVIPSKKIAFRFVVLRNPSD
jgi:hypothetical protein